MTSRRVKKQSNFFRLEMAICEYQFPFTAQIIPSLEFPDFQTNEQHIVTFLSEHCQQKLKVVLKDGAETSMNMTDNEVHYLKLRNDINYQSVADVIKEKRRENIEWLVVMDICSYKNHTLEVGHILHIENESKFNSLVRKNKRTLKVKVHPSGIQLSLPQELQIQLRKCDDYNSKKKSPVSDLAFQGNLPCLIFFPDNTKNSTTDGTSLAGEHALLKEQYTCRIVLGCKMNRNDEMEVHSFPSTLNLDMEILHGEAPVANFSDTEVMALTYDLIEKNTAKAEQVHQKRFASDINLKMFEYEDSSDDEDPYINTQDFSCNKIEPMVSQEVCNQPKANVTHRFVAPSEAGEDTTSHYEDVEDNGYIDMQESSIQRMLSNTIKNLPPYIKQNTSKLQKDFKFTQDPLNPKLTAPEEKKVYTSLDKGYAPPGYREVNQNIKSLKETPLHSNINRTNHPVPAVRPELPTRHSYIEVLPDDSEDTLHNDFNSTHEPKHENFIKTSNDNIEQEKVYTKLDQSFDDSSVYYELKQNNMEDPKGTTEDYEYAGYEVSYVSAPPLPPKTKSLHRPVPAKQIDANHDGVEPSYLQFLPEDSVNESAVEGELCNA